jgi:crotonobetainyl-CoA:carnitine CoA-transferase CaiB-like acyl-CoA transferase
MAEGALSHIRVLDLSRVMAAPWCTQILADLGADVIKIERPGEGDDTRGWGPPFLPGGRDAGYFLACNRGKRSVTVDMAKPEGQAIIRKLAESADVCVENFKVGALARYGLDAASLRAINPRLVYCSVTGFGQSGPRAGQAAYDFAIQAMGGLMSITGERDDAPGGGPQKVGVPVVDMMTGMYATVGILAALERRNITGVGERIDLAMLDVQAAFLSNQSMNFLMGGKTPNRHGNRHPNVQPQDVFACADGHFVLAVGNDGQFGKMAAAVGHPEWAQDARFATNRARVENGDAMRAALTARFADFTRAEITAALEAAGVPAAPINTIPQVFEEPQVKARQIKLEMDHPVAGKMPMVASPMRFSDTTIEYKLPPPTLGQHTDEVLRQHLQLDDAAIAKLRSDGIV